MSGSVPDDDPSGGPSSFVGLDLPGRLNADRFPEAAEYFEASSGSVTDRLAAFPRFVDRTSIGRFLVRYELAKLAMPVQGSFVECGVFSGFGLFAFAQISSLLEPLNHRRRVVGFDTFSGFPSVTGHDTFTGYADAHVGGLTGSSAEELRRGIDLFDRDRALKEIRKIHLVEGDFLETGPRFVEDNPHFVVSLLYLDFDLYEPTKRALELFLPLMPSGAVLAFDELHVAEFPGETRAVLETVGLRRLALRRFPFTSISYAVLDASQYL